MRFVIVGAGRVGLRTARALAKGGHEVVVVDSSESALERARAEGFEVVAGDGSLEATLAEAGIDDADALGALTGDLNDNFAACLVANDRGCRTVMRVDEAYREDIYRRYADQVDEVVYPERLGAVITVNAMLGGNARAVADIAQDLQLVEFTVTADSPIRGYTLSELEFPGECRLLAFGADDHPLSVPSPDQSVAAGDRLVVLVAFDDLESVREIIIGEAQRVTGSV
jgi:trk system potassium uptake protein TrkA